VSVHVLFSNVFFRFHGLISAALVAIVIAAGVPYVACTPAVCAANPDCALMRCSCCGPNCPMQKTKSRDPHKDDTGCNQQCPVVGDGKAMTAGNVRPVAALMLGAVEVQPCLVAYRGYAAVPVNDGVSLDPPTLLRLGCALTI
jgi:hypothetical protein